MPYADLLHIYDDDDWVIRGTAPHRRWHDSDIKEVGVRGGVGGLRSALDKLLKDKWTFSRILFLTHGSSGNISFNGSDLNSSILRKEFANNGYERLFPIVQTRMYFSGCNVADEDEGWTFLETAASIFLKSMGGVAFGDTSAGFAMHPIVTPVIIPPVLFPFVAGKSIHLWGDTRYVFVGPGGKFVKRLET